MKFETFDPSKHSLKQVASLVYDVDFRTFNKLYSTKEDAVKDISKRYSKSQDENFKVIIEDDEIIGILMLWIHKKPSFFQSLKEFTSFKLLTIDILDHFVLSNVDFDDVHIAELAISKQCRGKGIGRKIICQVIDYARKNNFKRVTLDADFRNNDAKRLYEKIGFKVFNKKEFLKRGMFNMEYVFEEN